MFYQFFEEGPREVRMEAMRPEKLTAGYVNVEELTALSERFGLEESAVAACRDANRFFRSGVEVYPDFTFTELRIMNLHEEEDDYIALFLMKNMILVVDIADRDGSTREKYLAAVRKYPAKRVCCEKLLAAFLDSLLAGDQTALERIENTLEEREDELQQQKTGKDFNLSLLAEKKLLSKRHSYYAQLLDITEAVCENDNDIFEERDLIHIDNVSKRIGRLKEETDALRGTVEHLQDAYSSLLEMRMNSTMKIFTVLTSVFFPLTIIVGWYGMNFTTMPELTWRYGYLYVIVLSVITVAVLFLIGKHKKWF